MNRFLLLTEKNRREVAQALPGESASRKLADYFQNFADSTRIKILTCLSMMNMCVNDLSTILGINQTTISHQLKTLKDQGIVSYKREGKILVYYLTSSSINDIMLYAVQGLWFDTCIYAKVLTKIVCFGIIMLEHLWKEFLKL